MKADAELAIATSQSWSQTPTLQTAAAYFLGLVGLERLINHLATDPLWLRASATLLLVAAWKLRTLAAKRSKPEFYMRLYADRLDVKVSLFQGEVPLSAIRRIEDLRSSFGIVKIYLRTGETIQFQPWTGAMELLAQTAELAGLPAFEP